MGKKQVTQSVSATWDGRQWAVVFIILFISGMGYVFAPVLSKWMAITSPDGGPFYVLSNSAQKLNELLAGKRVWTPHSFGLLFDPLFYHEFAYILSQLFLGLSGKTSGGGK